MSEEIRVVGKEDLALIGKQQLRIENLEAKNQALYERLVTIQKMLICIGGPLNDNKHKYSKEQMQIFFEIQKLTEG